MSYEKQAWQNGDTITAEKLNYMENGIENSSGYKYTVERDNEKQFLYDSGTTVFNPQEGLAGYQQEIEEPYMEWLESAALTGVCFSRIYNDGDKLPFFEGETSILKIDSDYIIGELDPDTSKPDLSKCPFYYMIYVEDGNLPIGTLITKDAGDYEIDFSEIKTTVITTPSFRQAVNDIVGELTGVKYVRVEYGPEFGYYLRGYNIEDFFNLFRHTTSEIKLLHDELIYTLQCFSTYNNEEYFQFCNIRQSNSIYELNTIKISRAEGVTYNHIQLQTVENMEG